MLLAVGALFLLAVRLPFFPPTFEDIDSVNFDLGVHDYSPPEHRPHPPGYPIYTVLAKAAHWFTDSHTAALSGVSSVTGALLVIPLYGLMRQLVGGRAAVAACALTVFNPLVWFNGARPMSDTAGLLLVTVSQWLLVGAAGRLAGTAQGGASLAAAGAFAAGLAAGVRIQSLVLVGPVLLLVALGNRRARARMAAAAAAGVLSWLVPLVALSGGPGRFVDSAYLTMQEAARAEPVVSRWSTSNALAALRDVVVAPWIEPAFAAGIVALAMVGLAALLRSAPRTAAWLLLLYLPYAVYHYLLQATVTYRYALPVVPLFAALAAWPSPDGVRTT
jgi:hypothetical protein